MSYYSAETVNPSKWLTPSEVQAVIERNKINVRSNRMKGRKQFPDRAQNFVIFRLACMGLRVSELTGLNCGDLIVTGERPVIIIRKETTKGVRGRHKGKEITIRRARKVPLYWDKGTLDDLKAWLEFRKAQIARQLAAGGKQKLRITITRSHSWAATLRSWVMNRMPRPRSAWISRSRARIWACTDTSRADTASSATSTWGWQATARAIARRCRCPPENWCG